MTLRARFSRDGGHNPGWHKRPGNPPFPGGSDGRRSRSLARGGAAATPVAWPVSERPGANGGWWRQRNRCVRKDR